MVNKSLSSNAWLSNIGAGISFLGWVLVLFVPYHSNLILITIISPLMYIILWLYGNRPQVWYDSEEIMGLLAAFTYLISVLSVLISIFWAYNFRDGPLGIYLGAPLLIMIGCLLISSRFIINSLIQKEES